MSVVFHQPQGLNVTFSLKLKQCLTRSHMIGRVDWHYILQQNNCLSVGPPCISIPKPTPLRIAGFKGNVQNDDSVTRANGLKIPKTSVRLEESGVVKSESSKAHSVPLSYTSEANESLTTSPAIHKLFKKWLTMLRKQPSKQEVEEMLGEPPQGVLLQKNEKGEAMKLAWSHFLSLDAKIKIPILIFAPLFLAINVIYGAEVSKELAPFWVLGPLIVAFYIMIVRTLCALYVFSFKQTVKVLKNLPSYCILVFSYVFSSKLKEDIKAHISQPILIIKTRDYKRLTIKKLKELAEGLAEGIVEMYLDFVESIWPYYCRTVRFLKRANLI